MVFRKIWIPSQRQFYKIKDLSVNDYMDLFRVIDDDEEFVDYINKYILENLSDKLNLDNITVLDRFVIFMYLKIFSCGKDLMFTVKCKDCGFENKIVLDLNESLDVIAPYIDKPFSEPFQLSNGAKIICQLPSVNRYANIGNMESLDALLFSFFKFIIIKNDFIEITTKNYKEIAPYIPYEDMLNVKNNYIDPLFNSLSSIKIFKFDCSSCKKELYSMDFNILNMTQIVKLIFQDDSLDNILYTIADINSMYHFDYEFYKNTTPLEINILLKRLAAKNTQKPQEDMFQSENMIETPSEFV